MFYLPLNYKSILKSSLGLYKFQRETSLHKTLPK